MSGACIRIRGARTHTLQNIDVDIPRQRLVVICGPSGSGKSSLAFDTLYAEGRRRYMQSLSTHARQFLGQLPRPEVDTIEGLAPAISVSQGRSPHNPRSTVGTVTEIHDHLRLLFARAGVAHCPQHQLPLVQHSIRQMVEETLALPEGTRIMVLAPLGCPGTAAEAAAALGRLQAQGHVRFRIDGQVHDGQGCCPPWRDGAALDVVVDRLKIRPDVSRRLAESLETALSCAAREGRGLPRAEVQDMDSDQTLRFSPQAVCPLCGHTAPVPTPALFSFNTPQGACPACGGLGCAACGHTRLGPQARQFLIGAHNIADIGHMPLAALRAWVRSVPVPAHCARAAQAILEEIAARLDFLLDVNLGYLTLARAAHSLSGGEAQRIALASQLGGGLSGVLYVLDEPVSSLHPRDAGQLIARLHQLRDQGNSVIVVEHHAHMLRAADHIIDLGPGAGAQGGHIVGQGNVAQLCAQPDSPTGRWLAGTDAIPVPKKRLRPRHWIEVQEACGHNLKNITARFPLGLLTCVSGVSGSGKSTLVGATLHAAAAQKLHRARENPAAHRAILGLEHFDKVVRAHQAPLGRSPRSNPATYCGLLDDIRALMAQTPAARERGWGPGRFSFNTREGQCPACRGEGLVRVPMHFLPDAWQPCPECGGQRYRSEVLEIVWRGHNMAQILDSSVEQAASLFRDQPHIAGKLRALAELGLGYLGLGQSATTLSGGEAQRVKLALELARASSARTLLILDEPTSGLHASDIAVLLKALFRLRDAGATIIVVEHQLEIIKTADWVIDLGPEAGPGGGQIVACGTPEELAACAPSHTGRALRAVLPQLPQLRDGHQRR